MACTNCSTLAEVERSTTNSPKPIWNLTDDGAFRQAAYQYLGKARDATFELTDAVLLTRTAYCLADLSLSPVFRRRWSSIYEALQDTRPQRQRLMQLYIEQMSLDVRPLLAGDHTCWERPEALTRQERTIEHSCTRVPGNRPIAVGQGYTTIAWIPEDEGSWALPLRPSVRRSFVRHWHTSCCSQTPWKVSRLASRETTSKKTPLSHRQKRFQTR